MRFFSESGSHIVDFLKPDGDILGGSIHGKEVGLGRNAFDGIDQTVRNDDFGLEVW